MLFVVYYILYFGDIEKIVSFFIVLLWFINISG